MEPRPHRRLKARALPRHVWAIRIRLELAGGIFDLALFNMAIDSKLRSCDLVRLRSIDIAWSAAKGMGAAANRLIDGAFTALLDEMLRAAGDDRLDAPLPAISDVRLARVVDYVEAHLDEVLMVGELAAVACVSHFGRLFRDATGLTPHRYVMERRLERAKAMLLTEPDLNLASVALACGFASHAHLSATFRARTGSSPGARKRDRLS